MATTLRQLVRNQILLREVNDRIAEVAGSWAGPSPEFLCECSHEDCTETVALTPAEYEQVPPGCVVGDAGETGPLRA